MIEIIRAFESIDLSNISEPKLKYLISKINQSKNKEYIYEVIFTFLADNIDGNMLFNSIYKFQDLNNYTLYLLHKNKVDISKLSISTIQYLVNNTPWGKSFVLKNIDTISQNKMFELVNLCTTKFKELYYQILNSFQIRENRLKFITHSVAGLIDFLTEDEIINSIYKNAPSECEQLTLDDTFKDNDNELFPNEIGHILLNKPYYKNIAIKHFKELFDSEKNNKLKFLSSLENNDEINEFRQKYRVFLKFYMESNCSPRTDESLSKLIDFDDYSRFSNKILKASPNLQISPIKINNSATSDVFALNNSILKLGTKRYTYNIDLNFFRIIPTSIYYVKDKNGKIQAVIEKQPNIDTNPEYITKEMIKELFLDFLKHGLYIADPHCLRYEPNNFGILRSYRDANLGEYKSHEDLPESFKKCPLVILDVDLIYRYDGPEAPPLIMLENITDFHSDILDYEKIKQIKTRVRNGEKL